ncbi:Flp pilus assembly protein CpaB [Nocardioides sp. Y6]|uniref:Flp pilus assembly protein CpaB n=1 Tax=Nocardioides malaquae TaxID=2773426 RepID=A0ABR9RNX9_9ACTN|nr:Flp pilus assembly protein CpaB [Nocardioides malaquae]MBE7323274.1 Flp pilus assembly protein CpaB [Nocardioides malaquae]
MDRRKLLLVMAVIVALAGAALVFVYVQGADNRAAEEYETVEVLTAVEPILTGETIAQAAEAGKLQRSRVPRAVLLPSAVSTVDSLKGLAANTNIYAGEQIVSDKFGGAGEASMLPIPEDKVAVTLELTDRARVSGFTVAGSRVAVWLTSNATSTGNEEANLFTRLVEDDVQVLAAGSSTLVASTTTDAEGGEVVEQLPKTLLTVAVDQDQAERLKTAVLWAEQFGGEVSFGLLSEKSKVRRSPGVESKNLFR